MPIEVINKVNNIINNLDNSSLITRMKFLKKEIDSNKEISKLIEEFSAKKKEYYHNQKIDESLIEVKKNLYDNPIILEYHSLEQELSYFILYVNRKLTSLVNTKKCQNPTHSRI